MKLMECVLIFKVHLKIRSYRVNKMKKIVFLFMPFFVSFFCIGSQNIRLSDAQLKAASVAFEHFNSHVKVTFFTPPESSDMRGNGKGVIYIVTKKEFTIKRTTQINTR